MPASHPLRGCTHLPSHPQWMRVLNLYPHLLQHLTVSVFLVFASPLAEKGHLVLICIYLITGRLNIFLYGHWPFVFLSCLISWWFNIPQSQNPFFCSGKQMGKMYKSCHRLPEELNRVSKLQRHRLVWSLAPAPRLPPSLVALLVLSLSPTLWSGKLTKPFFEQALC